MDKAEKTENRELSLGDDFGPAVIRINGLTILSDGNGNAKLQNEGITIDITDGNTSVFGGNVVAHTYGTVQLKPPAEEQTITPDVTQSSPAAEAYNPANAVVKAGQVPLNKLSRFLADLPDAAVAEFLVSPQDTAKIFGRKISTFNKDTASIRTIDADQGIHHEGQALAGMHIFDRHETSADVSYEQAWAKEVRSAWEQANESGDAVTTGLAIGTKQLISGRKPGSDDFTVANNMYSNVNDINAALVAQGGQEIATSQLSGSAVWQHTSSEYHNNPSEEAFIIDLSDGCRYSGVKDDSVASSRPVALHIAPDL